MVLGQFSRPRRARDDFLTVPVVEQVRVDQRSGLSGPERKNSVPSQSNPTGWQLVPLHIDVEEPFSLKSLSAAMPLSPAPCFFLYAQPFQPLVRHNRD